jgi:hypothetical protein
LTVNRKPITDTLLPSKTKGALFARPAFADSAFAVRLEPYAYLVFLCAPLCPLWFKILSSRNLKLETKPLLLFSQIVHRHRRIFADFISPSPSATYLALFTTCGLDRISGKPRFSPFRFAQRRQTLLESHEFTRAAVRRPTPFVILSEARPELAR